MINFLRKLRRNNLQSSKYLKYALGEIFLVVIGILIALSINNWNETRKNHKQETILLENLIKQLKTDVTDLNNNINSTETSLLRIDSTLSMLIEPDKINKLEFISRSRDFAFDSYFFCNCSIFDEAVSSGKMSLIQNSELRETIFTYYTKSKENSNDGSIKKITEDIITPILFRTIYVNKTGLRYLKEDTEEMDLSHDIPDIDFKSIRSDVQFWEMAFAKKAGNVVQINSWKSMKTNAQDLIEAIALELEELQ